MLSIMKTFLNVLYRRILYKIPLKLLLVLLAIFWLFFACTKADNVSDLITTINTVDSDVWWRQYLQVLHMSDSSEYWIYCLYVESLSNSYLTFWFNSSLSYWNWDLSYNIYEDWGSFYACLYANYDYIFLYNPTSTTAHINYKLFKLNALMNTWLPTLTSQECQSKYNLIPINEVDNAYCESNNLCSLSCSPTDCPNVWVSNLFINDVFHPGAFNIIMNIPEEISRDYAYTNSWYNFNLDIEWYNVDYEKMQSVIDKQSYIPTNEDFQNIILLIWPYWKIIIFFVFLFILWAWIKKPFKSKL